MPGTGSCEVPSAARYPVSAAGSIPSRRNCRSERLPRRFESGPPSASRSSGRWAKRSARRIAAERLPEVDLHAGVGDVVLAAHDVRDAAFQVVHDGGEGVERRAVAADHHRIGQARQLHRPPPEHVVIPLHGAPC